MRARTRCGTTLLGVLAGALVATLAGPAQAADGGHGFGRMGPSSARTTTVRPSSGPDFEMPFLCGQTWTGSTRSSHSPSSWTIDWNATNDLGRPALSSAPGIVTRAASLTGSYGRHVVVDHGRGYTTLYAHLNSLVARVGQVVDQGDLLGYVGTSGNSTGPHLHHEERLNGSYFRHYLHRAYFSFGSTRRSANCTDRPMAGDWNGDGRTDVGVLRMTPTGAVAYVRTGSTARSYRFGTVGDVPFTGDFDGDGTSQLGLHRRGTTTYTLRGRTGRPVSVTRVGAVSDIAVSGDWNGDRRSDLGYYRSSTHTFYLRSAKGALTAVRWGSTGDQPVTGDWNGDRRTDVGVFNPTTRTWRLRVPSGRGFVTRKIAYGAAGDNIPVTGDWDGDRKTDVGVWRPSLGRFYQRTVAKGTSRVVSKWVTYGLRRG
jgi:hypothetical protein